MYSYAFGLLNLAIPCISFISYEIEAELGRLDIKTYRVTRGSRTVFNSKVNLFPKTAQEEKYHSACYDILALRLASSIPSYRICDEILNRLRWQDNEKKIKLRTLTDAVEREGNKIIDYINLNRTTAQRKQV